MQATKRTVVLPRVGQRIIRSVVAVALCFCVFFIRDKQGIPFYSALAILQCIQPYQESTRKVAKKRVTGTFVGAFWGLVMILIQLYAGHGMFLDTFVGYLLVAVFTGLVLYSTVVLKCKETAYFSCVVFLSITVMHITDEQPFLFVLNRVAETLIGVAIALAVNSAHLPGKCHNDVLFVSGIDDTILDSREHLSPYCKVELNRMIDMGAHFTVSTIRTPASVREALPGVQFRYPIIAMDGAVLYDMQENSYLMKYQMPSRHASVMIDFLEKEGFRYFTNVILDDLLIIYYRNLVNEAEKGIYRTRKKSPYRNYVQTQEQICDNVVYFLLIDEKKAVTRLYEKMMHQPWHGNYRIVMADSMNYPGYAHIKIYHKDATREHMLTNLKAFLNLDQTVTFGSIEGKYDVLISDSNKDDMVVQLKKQYITRGFVWQRTGIQAGAR